MTMIALRDPLRDTIIARPLRRASLPAPCCWALVSFVDFEQARAAPIGARCRSAPPLLWPSPCWLPAAGPAGSGAKVNLFGLQPVEAIRLLVVFALAGVLRAPLAVPARVLRKRRDRGACRRHLQLPRWKDVRPLGDHASARCWSSSSSRRTSDRRSCSRASSSALYGLARGRGRRSCCVALPCSASASAADYLLGVPDTVAQRVAIWLDPWDNAPAGRRSDCAWAVGAGERWSAGASVLASATRS